MKMFLSRVAQEWSLIYGDGRGFFIKESCKFCQLKLLSFCQNVYLSPMAGIIKAVSYIGLRYGNTEKN